MKGLKMHRPNWTNVVWIVLSHLGLTAGLYVLCVCMGLVSIWVALQAQYLTVYADLLVCLIIPAMIYYLVIRRQLSEDIVEYGMRWAYAIIAFILVIVFPLTPNTPEAFEKAAINALILAATFWAAISVIQSIDTLFFYNGRWVKRQGHTQ